MRRGQFGLSASHESFPAWAWNDEVVEKDRTQAERGAKRVLAVLGSPRERPRHSLMYHEFVQAFSVEGWTLDDLKTATKFAFEAGWISLDGNLYCLVEGGKTLSPSGPAPF